MLRLVEDVSDTGSQKAALSFFTRCVAVWGQPLTPPSAGPDGQVQESTGLPGFERFIYEQLVPTAFAVPSLPEFNLKDGQMVVVRSSGTWSLSNETDSTHHQVLQEVGNLLQAVVKVRGHEAQSYFATVYLPSQGWPADAAIEFSTKLQELDTKAFRKYFSDLIRASRSS